MKTNFLKFFLLILVVSCSPSAVRMNSREIASVDVPTLKYITYNKDGSVHVELVNPSRWISFPSGDGARQHLLIQLWAANTRMKSNTGLRHDGCFLGSAQDIQKSFFDKSQLNHYVRDLEGDVPQTKASSDGMMIGIYFKLQMNKDTSPKTYFFRMPNCNSGKSAIDENTSVKPHFTDISPPFNLKKFMAKMHPLEDKSSGRAIATENLSTRGFILNDLVSVPGLKPFELQLKPAVAKEVFPWQSADVRDEVSALKLSMILQKYIYEEMANQNPNADENFVVQKNKKRTFCHTPWLNVGPSEREGLHGLTKERDMKSSTLMKTYSNVSGGSNWGVAYYNEPGCNTLSSVYGSNSAPNATPKFDGVVFQNGTLSAKLLYTTANFPGSEKSFSWRANVSGPGSTDRSVQPVRFVQMDIAIKDTSIKGVNSKINNWIMFTYYFDPNFDYELEYKNIAGANPLLSIPKLPISFLKMRPMGVQFGFDLKESIIFKGAQTNSDFGHLNGPADNPKSSCMGCHGTSGVKGAGMVPGFLNYTRWDKNTPGLDFSQQLALGKRNFETSFEGMK